MVRVARRRVKRVETAFRCTNLRHSSAFAARATPAMRRRNLRSSHWRGWRGEASRLLKNSLLAPGHGWPGAIMH
jgi:hypothetical protein